MTKRKRKARGSAAEPASRVSVAMPTSWDMGASGKANRQGLTIEEVGQMDTATGEVINPNGVMRARRVDMLEVWHRRGTITTAGFTAAERLRDAFEGTQRSPGMAQSERVQSSPKPDHAVTIQIDRMSRFVAESAHVAPDDRAIIEACVLDGASPQRIRKYRGGRGLMAGLEHLRNALDHVAKSMESAKPDVKRNQ